MVVNRQGHHRGWQNINKSPLYRFHSPFRPPSIRYPANDCDHISALHVISWTAYKSAKDSNLDQRRIVVDGHIHYVDDYIYLVSFSSRQDKKIERRIENGQRSCLLVLKGTFEGLYSLKRKLLDICILPILAHGAQTWPLTESQKFKFKISQRALKRSILGVRKKNHVRNITLRSNTCSRCSCKSSNIKRDWDGHVCRMNSDWAQSITNWVTHESRRRRERPMRGWRDDLDAYIKNWPVVKKNRDIWRFKGEAIAQQWGTLGSVPHCMCIVGQLCKRIVIDTYISV